MSSLGFFLHLAALVNLSNQACRSTVAVTTCSHDVLKTSQPIKLENYKSFLSFEKGDLTAVPPGVFKFLPEVTILQLSHNKIRSLDEKSFENLSNLKQLSLYDNNLDTIQRNDFKSCANLEKLDLGLNRISSIDKDAFGNFPKLEWLNLGFNALKEVPVSIHYLTNLRILKLGNNQIDALRGKSLKPLSKLEDLSLNDNRISLIDRNAFEGLSKLTRLDLKSNYISHFDISHALSHMPILKWLDLKINSFDCNTLKELLKRLKENRVEVPTGVSKKENSLGNSINGITCLK